LNESEFRARLVKDIEALEPKAKALISQLQKKAAVVERLPATDLINHDGLTADRMPRSQMRRGGSLLRRDRSGGLVTEFPSYCDTLEVMSTATT